MWVYLVVMCVSLNWDNSESIDLKPSWTLKLMDKSHATFWVMMNQKYYADKGLTAHLDSVWISKKEVARQIKSPERRNKYGWVCIENHPRKMGAKK